MQGLDEYYGMSGTNHVTAQFGASYWDNSAITAGFDTDNPSLADMTDLENEITTAIQADSALAAGNPATVQAAPIYIVLTDPEYKPRLGQNENGGFNATGQINGTTGPDVNIITVGTGEGRATLDVTNMISAVSHEMAEGMTSPNTIDVKDDGGVDYLLNTINFTLGSSFPAGGSFGPGQGIQVADGEPEGQGSTNGFPYRYRLGGLSGPVAQAIWSAARQEFIVQDGTTQDFDLTPLSNAPLNLSGEDDLSGLYKLTINGDQMANKDDHITISTDPTGNTIEVNLNGEIAYFNSSITRLATIQINGGSGNNTLTVDFGNGLPLPTGGTFWSAASPGGAMTSATYAGINFDGGTGTNNQLILQGTPPSAASLTEVSTPSGPHAGSVTFDRSTITYSNLAPIDDTVGALFFTINGTAASEQIDMLKGPTIGGFATTLINSSSFELINFANKGNVVVNGNGGNDTFLVDFSQGNPIPANGISFQNSTGTKNQLILQGTDPLGAYMSEVSTPTGPDSGEIAFNGSPIYYSGMDQIFDTVSVTSFTQFNPFAPEQTNMVRGSTVNGFATTEINSSSGYLLRLILPTKRM